MLPIVSSTGTLTDPFVDPKFLNAVEWLADIATPDGMHPPIDDSYREEIFPAQILNWSSAYGSSLTGQVGAKYQRIVAERGGYGFRNWLRLIELSMPRQQSTTVTYTDKVIGSTSPSSLTDQQVIINYVDAENKKHYLYFNGEHGDAIMRG